MSDPYKTFTTLQTPQSEPIPGANQVVNNAGGYVYQVSDRTRVERFLILGTAGNHYYTTEKELTREEAQFLIDYAQRDGMEFLALIRDVSVNGRAYKQNPTLFALAIACSFGTPETKAAALGEVSTICRTGTMLFKFNAYLEQFRGRGRAVKTAMRKWYTERSTSSLENQLVKYQQREGWSHRDLLRLAMPKPDTDARKNAFAWSVGKEFSTAELPMIAAFEKAKAATSVDEVVAAITEGNLPWEAVPSQWLREPKVWEAILPHLGLNALMRNLGRLSNIGLLTMNSDASKLVISKVMDPEALRAQRVHPMQALLALVTYNAGRGVKGDLKWTPVPRVIDAVEEAFYMSFGNVEPTGKRRGLFLDTSGSMSAAFGGTHLRSCEATAAMAMIAVRSETTDVYTKHFSDGGGGRYARGKSAIGDLNFTPKMTLKEATRVALDENWGGTDCALPMIWAAQNNIAIDSFEVYTDSETWAGNIHPVQALKQYRDKMGIPAKLVVVGTQAGPFTIADPNDPGMMDFVGFDAAAPQAISYFITS